MPPLAFLAVLGVGCYAGFKIVSKLADVSRAAKAARATATRRNAAKATTTRDLGDLEWDASNEVYRPKHD